MKHFLIILTMLSVLTINSTAQETEDVVYLKNGSIIRGVITELIPDVNIRIQTRDNSVFVFQMNEVQRVAKEPVSGRTPRTEETEDVVYLKNGSIIRGVITELIPDVNIRIQTRDNSVFVFQMDKVQRVAKEPVSGKTLRPYNSVQGMRYEAAKTVPTSLELGKSAFGGLLLGAHSSLGMNLPFIGAMGLYDTKIDLSALSSTDSATGRIGVIGTLEYSFAKSDISDVLDVDADFLLVSALVCLGFQTTRNSVFRFGSGVAFTSVEAKVFNYGGGASSITPTAIAAWTFHPQTENRESFAMTFSIRWQGEGVMFAITPGILQRGIGR